MEYSCELFFVLRFRIHVFMLQSKQEQVIMGVDPGTNVLGYCVIRVDNNALTILTNSVIHLKKTDGHVNKLRHIYDILYQIIKQHKPTVLAIEAPFYAKNVQSMLKLGRAQGAAMLAAVHLDLEVIEYSPRKIKQSITGKGNASKEQVARMLQSMLKFTSLPAYFDETDALAAAVCHVHASGKVALTSRSFHSWDAYIKANPKRVAKI
jgi:crossover junction endodeoxyribonuclease RuvC